MVNTKIKLKNIFSPLPSLQLDESTLVWPSCHYTIRSETVEGPVARTVEVGDLIIHRWQCDNRIIFYANYKNFN